MEVRTLAAPKLAASNLGSRLRCYRPCRRGPPRMEVEELRNGQIIVGHNYGHGGAGWTLAPGAARHVNSLLLEVVERRQQQRW
jgi:D-amino-acid oxidase